MSLLAMGLGQGTITIPSMSAAYASVARRRLAVANTAINICQRLGGPLATTVTSIVLSLGMAAPPGRGSYLAAFVLLAGLQVLTIGAAIRLPRLVHPAS